MKALSVRQPWAELIASGEKTIEVRTWKTSYRGELLICASRSIDRASEHFDDCFAYPTGCGVAIAELVDCRLYRVDGEGGELDDAASLCWPAEGCYAWELANVRRLEKPFAVKGKLNLFQVELPEGAVFLQVDPLALPPPPASQQQTALAASSS